jgi:Heparinase II/III-like protein
VTFSDSAPDVRFQVPHLVYLARRLDLPDLMALAADQEPVAFAGDFGWALRGLFWPAERLAGRHYVPKLHDWWPGLQWMIARCDPADPGALVLAAKGGHNREMHNHNDVGALIVHCGRESLIEDLGPGRYTRAYFGEARFEHPAASSYGHAVPVPNGQAQRSGRQYAAQVLEHSASATVDRLVLELRAAYPVEADLASLRRTVALQRDQGAGWIHLTDEASFASAPGTLESALITRARVELGSARVMLRGERAALDVSFDRTTVTPRVEVLPQVDLASGACDVNRIVFAHRERAFASRISLRLEPMS